MTTLADFPEEVWQGILPYIKNYHFVRLIATGDVRLKRRLCAVRERHFDLPTNVSILGHSNAVLSSALDAHSLRATAYQFMELRRWDAPFFSKLAKLHLGAPGGCNPPLPQYNFKSFVSLLSLRITGYRLNNGLSLPPSVTSVKVDRFDFALALDAEPITGLALLTSLRSLHLKSTRVAFFQFREDTVLPSSVESLSVYVGAAGLGQLPPGLKKLNVDARPTLKIDLFELVTKHCPALVSLNVRCSVTATSRVPPGLETLIVGLAVAQSHNVSLRETVENLPPSLRRINFGALSGDVVPALDVLLPRLQFVDFDNVCRIALRYAQGIECQECLLKHAARWFDGDQSVASAYVAVVRSTVYLCWQSGQRSMPGECLFAIAGAIGDDRARQLFPSLIACQPVTVDTASMPKNRRLFDTPLKLLELGVIHWLGGLASCVSSLALSSDAVRNLVTIQEYSPGGFDAVASLLKENGTLPYLQRIEVGDRSHDADYLIDILHEHRLKLPALEFVECHGRLCNGVYAEVGVDTVAKMAEMRLYQTGAADQIAFVCRVQPPRPQVRCVK